MRKQTMKKLVLGFLIVTALGLTACGAKKDDEADGAAKTTATETTKDATTEKQGNVSEVADTTEEVSTEAVTTEAEVTEAETTEADATGQSEQSGTADEVYAGITQGEAVTNVRRLEGSGATILSVEKGASPRDGDAWVIRVAPVGKAEDPVEVTYYVSDSFCFTE